MRLRSASSRLLSRDVKSFGLEVSFVLEGIAERVERALPAADASLNARPRSLPEEDSTILRIALMDHADSGLLGPEGRGCQ